MSKTFLMMVIFLVSLSTTTHTQDTFPTSQPNSQPFSISSSLPPISTYTPPCHEVSAETFRFLNHAINVLQHQDRLDASGVEGPNMALNTDGYNLQAIGKELRTIDKHFPKDFANEHTLKIFIENNQVIVRCSTYKLHLGESYLDNKPLSAESLATLDVVIDKKPIQEGSLLSSIVTIVNSSFFKASCIATITAALTYYAVGFYNKDKNIEKQYSQKKWALGAATVTGISAFAYLYWRTQAVLSPDDFEVIE